jgi:hypothetical protein
MNLTTAMKMKIEKDAVRLADKIARVFMSFFSIVIFANLLLMVGAQIVNYLLQ